MINATFILSCINLVSNLSFLNGDFFFFSYLIPSNKKKRKFMLFVAVYNILIYSQYILTCVIFFEC